MSQFTETEWRCTQCGTLLGVEKNGSIHVRYKRVQLKVDGHVLAVCPRCSALNERGVTDPQPPAAYT